MRDGFADEGSVCWWSPTDAQSAAAGSGIADDFCAGLELNGTGLAPPLWDLSIDIVCQQRRGADEDNGTVQPPDLAVTVKDSREKSKPSQPQKGKAISDPKFLHTISTLQPFKPLQLYSAGHLNYKVQTGTEPTKSRFLQHSHLHIYRSIWSYSIWPHHPRNMNASSSQAQEPNFSKPQDPLSNCSRDFSAIRL